MKMTLSFQNSTESYTVHCRRLGLRCQAHGKGPGALEFAAAQVLEPNRAAIRLHFLMQ